MLRIGERRVARGEAEELGIELIHVRRATGDAFTYPGSCEICSGIPAARISSRQRGDGLDACQIAPELIEIVGAGETAAHADDRDRFELSWCSNTVTFTHRTSPRHPRANPFEANSAAATHTPAPLWAVEDGVDAFAGERVATRENRAVDGSHPSSGRAMMRCGHRSPSES